MNIQFQSLWTSHPLNLTPPEPFPCKNKDGMPAFDNQCAIKMSVALIGATANLDACHKVKCWYGHTNHVIRAQELADWLAEAAQLGSPTRYTKGRATQPVFQQTVLSGVQGKNGIVFCQNFWGAGNQGDHIDVWNGTVMSGANANSDYFGRSGQVWFWELTT